MILPLIVMAASVLTQFLVMWGISFGMTVVAFAPSMMLSITLAVGIDYTLFLLKRFLECGPQRRHSLEYSILVMVQSAGHVILISGVTLMCCFLSNLVLPDVTLRSAAVASMFAIFFSLLSSLTLIPAVLFICGPSLLSLHFRMERFVGRTCPWYFRLRGREAPSAEHEEHLKEVEMKEESKGLDLIEAGKGEETRVDKQSETEDSSDDDSLELPSSNGCGKDSFYELDEDIRLSQTLWYKLGKFLVVSRNSWLVVIGISILLIPFGMKISSLKSLPAWTMELPRGSDTLNCFTDVAESFQNEGIFFP